MAKLQAIVRQYNTPLLLLLLLGGYAVILGELVLYQHWDGIQLVAVVATSLGMLCVLAGFFAKGALRMALAVVLVLVSLSGVIGTYQHYESQSGEGEEGALMEPQAAQAGYTMISDRSDGAVMRAPAQEANESGEGSGEVPPPLAPLGIAGLSLMAAVVVLAKRDESVGAGK